MSNENEKDNDKEEKPEVSPPKQPNTEGQRKRFVDLDLDKQGSSNILNKKLKKQ